MKLFISKKNYIRYLIIIFCFTSLIISLGTFPDLSISKILNLSKEFSIIESLRFLRQNLILILPIALITIIIKSKKLIISTINLTFLIYLGSQIFFLFFSYFISKIINNFYFHFHFIYCSFMMILTFIILDNEKKLQINLYLIFFIIISFLITNIIQELKPFNGFFMSYDLNYNYGSNKLDKYFNININSNGLGRYLFIFYIITLYFNLKFLKKNKYFIFLFFFIINIFFGTNILLSDSRFLFGSLLILTTFIIFFSKVALKKKIIFFFLIITAIFYSYTSNIKSKNNKIENTRIYKFQGELIRDKESVIINKENFIINKENVLRDKENEIIDIISTGRVSKWKYLLDISIKNKLLGFAPEYERDILIRKNNYFWGSDAANGFIYSLISGGLPGLIIFIFLVIYTLKKIWNLLKSKKLLNFRNSLLDISVILIFFLILRCIVENSFASWSFDFVLFTLSVNILNFYTSKKFK